MSKGGNAYAARHAVVGIAPFWVPPYRDRESRAPTILVLGDRSLVADGIGNVLARTAVRGEVLYGRNATDGVELLQRNRIDLVLLDFTEDVMMRTLMAIREHDETVRVILLANPESTGAVSRAAGGAGGARITERVPPSLLVQATGVAFAGQRLAILPLDLAAECCVLRMMAKPAKARHSLRDRFAELTGQEIRLLSHMGHGMSNEEIARKLGILEGTVKARVKSILRKLKAKNRTVAALMAASELRTH